MSSVPVRPLWSKQESRSDPGCHAAPRRPPRSWCRWGASSVPYRSDTPAAPTRPSLWCWGMKARAPSSGRREVTGVKVGDKVALNWANLRRLAAAYAAGPSVRSRTPSSGIAGPDEPYRNIASRIPRLAAFDACQVQIVDRASCVRLPATCRSLALLGCGVRRAPGCVVHAGGVEEGNRRGVRLRRHRGQFDSGCETRRRSRIIACDIKQSNLDLALRFGATDVVNVARPIRWSCAN